MKLYAEQAAQRAGVKPSTWRDYYNTGRTPGAIETGPSRRPGHPRRADGEDRHRGHVRPWWWAETVDTYTARERRPGARTDLAKETTMRTWTLYADTSAAHLQTIVQEYFPGQIAPGVSDGTEASVTALSDPGGPPEWMRQLVADYAGIIDVVIEDFNPAVEATP